MRLLQLLLIAAMYLLPIQSASPKSIAENICNKLGIIYTSGIFRSNEEKEMNNVFTRCQNSFLSYIKTVGVPSESEINYFVNIMYSIAEKDQVPLICSNLIDHFKKLNYRLIEITELFESFNNHKNFERLSYMYQAILFDYPTWNKLKEIENLNIRDCVFKFEVDTKNRLDAVNSFINWLKSNNSGSKKNYCNCNMVLGLNEIYKKRNAGNINYLNDLYKNVCTIDFLDKEVWNENNLKCIGDTKNPLNGKILKQFLSLGVSLAKYNWCKDGATSISFDEISEKIHLTEDSVLQNEIEIMSYIVSVDFSRNYYDKFLKILTNYGHDFLARRCTDNIIRAAFQREMSEFNKNQYPKKTYVWDLMDTPKEREEYGVEHKEVTHPFNDHIELLLEIFLKNNCSGSCHEFVEFLSKFKASLVRRNFTKEDLTKNLIEVLKKRVDTSLLLQCYEFTMSLEEEMAETYELMRANYVGTQRMDYIFFGLASKFCDFRNALFKRAPFELKEICNNQHPEFNIKSKEAIFKLLKFVFQNSADEDSTLLEVFK